MPEFFQAEEHSDSQRLQLFLGWTHGLLRALVSTEQYSEWNHLIDTEVQRLLSHPSVDPEGPIYEMVNSLDGIDPQHLHRHQLSGDALLAKLGVVDRLWQRFQESPSPGFLKRLLDAIDAVLDSIIDMLGFGGPAKEFKDSLSAGVEIE